jgi:hypothetical protein
MIYQVYFSDAGVPKTLLTPTWAYLYTIAGAPVIGPAISEIGGGWYKFTLAPTENLVGAIDGGAGLANADRYPSVFLTPNDDSLRMALGKGSGKVIVTLDNATTLVQQFYDIDNMTLLFTLTTSKTTGGRTVVY